MIALILLFIMVVTLRVLSLGKEYDAALDKEIHFN